MTVPCRLCHRSDCPLLATSIIGERAYHAALIDCMTHAPQPPKPREQLGANPWRRR